MPKCIENPNDELFKDKDIKFLLDEYDSIYVNIQELEIQQPIDLMKNPEEPARSIRVFLENSRGVFSGRVKVVGRVMKREFRHNLPIYRIYIKSNYNRYSRKCFRFIANYNRC